MHDRVEKAFDLQEEYIKENFPTDVKVNLGWCVDEIDGYVATKVYGHGVLTTDLNDFTHEFEPYS